MFTYWGGVRGPCGLIRHDSGHQKGSSRSWRGPQIHLIQAKVEKTAIFFQLHSYWLMKYEEAEPVMGHSCSWRCHGLFIQTPPSETAGPLKALWHHFLFPAMFPSARNRNAFFFSKRRGVSTLLCSAAESHRTPVLLQSAQCKYCHIGEQSVPAVCVADRKCERRQSANHHPAKL